MGANCSMKKRTVGYATGRNRTPGDATRQKNSQYPTSTLAQGRGARRTLELVAPQELAVLLPKLGRQQGHHAPTAA